ncbi:hypothetical protein EDC01DRAFT_717266 [Geopyxis carbonaria]|nr:hypothetical protein EDC01DRAFT_717266 [Geopyxis carbonaria]
MPPKKNKTKPPFEVPVNKAAAEPEKKATLEWPALSPLLPPEDLQLQTILPGQIITIPRFFTNTLCRTYVSYLEKATTLTTTPVQPKKGNAVRVNDRSQVLDKAFAQRLWEDSGLKEVIQREDPALWGGEIMGLNPNIRIYRYRTGQFFDKHYDESNQVSFGDPPQVYKTTWTLLIYLTGTADGIKGGETVFYTDATKKKQSETIVAELEKGTALLHKHGRDCLLHEGRLVEDDGGIGKWVLRSDLCIKR